MGISPKHSSVLFWATTPVAAKTGGTVPCSVLSKSAVSFAVIIFGMSARFAIKLWKPSMKIMSSFSFSSSPRILSRSFSSRLVFLMMSISVGDIATTTLLPACAYRHVLVPSRSMEKSLWCMCLMAPTLRPSSEKRLIKYSMVVVFPEPL
jgi:hypothetical protein